MWNSILEFFRRLFGIKPPRLTTRIVSVTVVGKGLRVPVNNAFLELDGYPTIWGRVVGVGRVEFDVPNNPAVYPLSGTITVVGGEEYYHYHGPIIVTYEDPELSWVFLEAFNPPLPRIIASGRNFVTERGDPFVFRGVTAFRLLELLSQGKDSEVEYFLDWAHYRRFNTLRVLTSMAGWFTLYPDEGIQQLRRLAPMANERKLYIQPVGLAETKRQDLSEGKMFEHLRQLSQLASEFSNISLIEIANEPYHSTQQSKLTEEWFALGANNQIHLGHITGYGASPNDEDPQPYSLMGDVLLVHPSRSRDKWNRTRHWREMELLSLKHKVPVIANEPIGAGDVDSSSRSSDPNEFYAQGVLSRILGIGATFHFDDGLHAKVPIGIQDDAAGSFVHGTMIVPDHVRLVFKNSGWHDSPVKGFQNAIRAYSGVDGNSGIVLLLGSQIGATFELREGWRVTSAIIFNEIEVHFIERT